MKKRLIKLTLLIFFICLAVTSFAQQQRFPKPEFETGYVQPPTQQPLPRALFLEYLDVIVLIGALILVSWFLLKKRSRQGVLWTSVFSLLYFGFYREGCICAIGSIQNVALAIFDPTYTLPLTALLFFLIPLITALFAGRTFCAGVCPLGAIQDLVAFKPIELPRWLQKVLGLIPYVYLSLAVLYAATRSEFLICRYDPFVGFFRFDGTFQMLLLGGLFLLVGVFVARPYCRFFCPYGVLLGWMSSFSKKHVTITPSTCIQCKLCSNSCPFGAIEEPLLEEGKRRSNVNRLMTYLILIPIWMGIGGLSGSMLHGTLAKFNKTVYLAEMLVQNPDIRFNQENIDARTFMQKGKTMDELVVDAQKIKSQFYWGGWIAGAFMGLVVGLVLVNLSSYRRRNDYEPDRTNCLSCGRCVDYCPVK
ncbi:4Fe-4S binding protein [Mangrovibacterium lignilyticum]|uniref:4Fe-4S binding protein n=1 Tax=Mangrovibacterium lignilyticum TaxID=2668052 RepID=UPI0013D7AC26|nr:4Fe-4S binding protein [Mangrovibacterium lignilyticum]